MSSHLLYHSSGKLLCELLFLAMGEGKPLIFVNTLADDDDVVDDDDDVDDAEAEDDDEGEGGGDGNDLVMSNPAGQVSVTPPIHRT